jgi:hypothetical protein
VTAASAEPTRYRHALWLSDADPHVEGLADASTRWDPKALEVRYGEPLVASAAAALRACGADLLVVDWPPARTSASRALAWSALEAARRSGEMNVALGAWPTDLALPPGGDVSTRPGVCLLDARRLDDVWPTLWRATGGIADATPAPAGPRVSVIVRSMDRATLDAALDSVAWQTYRPIDIVVVNALGTSHRRLAGAHGDLALQMVGRTDGAPLARAEAANVGLGAATGDLLLFLDDDDVLLPDHVAKLAAALAAAPQAPAAYGDVDFGHMGPDGWHSRHVFAADFDPVRLCFENYLPIHAVLFRRACVDRGARVDERLHLLEDWDFWLQCAAEGPFVRVPGVSARYQANSPGGSEVFEEGPLARESRATLFAKWHRRLSTEHFVDLMFRLQAHYRGEAYALAQLQLAQDEVRGLREILAARDTEIASLQTALAERDAQVHTASEHARSLAQVLAERDVQAKTAREYADSLREVLAARDAEIESLRAELDRLRSESPLSALKRTLHFRHHDR